MSRAYTGQTHHFISDLSHSIQTATRIKIIVAFIKESGVRELSNALKQAAKSGADIEILTGTYLQVTEPSALFLLKDQLGDKAHIKVFTGNISFHPKGYWTQRSFTGTSLGTGDGIVSGIGVVPGTGVGISSRIPHNHQQQPPITELYIGSSNISRSGLIYGVEWNYKLHSDNTSDHPALQTFQEEFDQLFQHQAVEATDDFLKAYALQWRKSEVRPFIKPFDPAQLHTITSTSTAAGPPASRYLHPSQSPTQSPSPYPASTYNPADPQTPIIHPRGAQIEALYQLKLAREEGATRGLVVAATGVGKTYIAAFDVQRFKAKRALFIAHRDEILQQAIKSFEAVHPTATTCLFTGQNKQDFATAQFVFASVQTLGRETYLNPSYFSPHDFCHITVDEFHHAAAPGYRRILGYFTPKFLLGLTATPYRMDNQDLLALVSDQIIYQIDLISAINRGLLCPYKYYAVYDDSVNFDQVVRSGGKYDIASLEAVLALNQRKEQVLEKYKQLAGASTIAFCASINHAEDMAAYFNSKKVNSKALHSQSEDANGQQRQLALREFSGGNIQVLFVVDLFNEGVDIPSVDTVLFLRPTESYVVFMQQLGRGLRLHQGKAHLTVIDFIGNYKRAHYKPLLLAGLNPYGQQGAKRKDTGPMGLRFDQVPLPEGCSVQYDLRLIDLFKEMSKLDPKPLRLREEFKRLFETLGTRPTRLEVHLGSDLGIKEFLTYKHSQDKEAHIPDGYLKFLEEQGALSQEESTWLEGPVESFLRMLEKTSMARSYKIPVLRCLVAQGGRATHKEIGQAFEAYYKDNPSHLKELMKDTQNRQAGQWSTKEFTRLALQNPVHFLARTEHEFIKHNDIAQTLAFSQAVLEAWTPALQSHVADIIDLRETLYYARRYQISED